MAKYSSIAFTNILALFAQSDPAEIRFAIADQCNYSILHRDRSQEKVNGNKK
ncbi:MAG: hypothetical protein VKL42_12260 [Snowella sp.]|nr:hypothetical protein [Snowella sp.]